MEVVKQTADYASTDTTRNSMDITKNGLIALRAQASAAQRSEESRLSGKNRRASREKKPVAQ